MTDLAIEEYEPIQQSLTHQPLPSWLTSLRQHQVDALEEIRDAYRSGARVVWLDGPTGAGKTAIGECARRMMKSEALYVCSGLTLQDQFLRDFPYAKVLKGRSNYPSTSMLAGNSDSTCDLCTRQGSGGVCWICPDDTTDEPTCPYKIAKGQAKYAELAVLNTTYLLNEANGPRPSFSGRSFVIADECDELEGELLRYTEFRLSERMSKRLNVKIPGKGIHYTTIAKWLVEQVVPALTFAVQEMGGRRLTPVELKQRTNMKRMKVSALRTARELEAGGWVRDDDRDGLVLKPISVARFGQPALWKHGNRWLAMSATIVSSAQLSEDLGISDWKQATVTVPMTFPVENRPIFFAPVADMSQSGRDEGWPRSVTAISNLLVKHDGDRVLIHAVSYAYAEYLTDKLRRLAAAGYLGNRKIITYSNSGMREMAVARYRKTPNAVIVAPSLDRGVDFKGDDCRVVIVAKVPYAYLGDKQVSARMNGPGGNMWYTIDVIRTLVQMTGRGVRSADDYCTTYILDRGFKRMWREHKNKIPSWWREAVDTEYPVPPLLKRLDR